MSAEGSVQPRYGARRGFLRIELQEMVTSHDYWLYLSAFLIAVEGFKLLGLALVLDNNNGEELQPSQAQRLPCELVSKSFPSKLIERCFRKILNDLFVFERGWAAGRADGS